MLANISKHLAFMKRAGLVERRKSGNRVYYSVRNSDILGMYDSICRDIEKRFESRKPAAAKEIKPMAARKPTAKKMEPTVPKKPEAAKGTEPAAARKPVAEKKEPVPAIVKASAAKCPPKPAETMVARPQKKASKKRVDVDIHQPSLWVLTRKKKMTI